MSSVDPDTSCIHYERNCELKCSSCTKFYPCRVCHDEVESHTFDRYNVKSIKCKMCNEVQEKSNKCTNCEVVFARYFCGVCSMFDDRDKGQFHCIGCNICRIGGKDKFFHCPKCDMCYAIDIKETHRCIEKSSRSNCAVCMDDLHSSRDYLHVPDCGHLLHRTCFKSLLKTGNYKCPTCGKSMVDMSDHWTHRDREVEATQMPPEYRNKKMWILCQDCLKTSHVKFHVLGMKCGDCGSYNTCDTKPPDGAEEDNEDENTEFYVEEMD